MQCARGSRTEFMPNCLPPRVSKISDPSFYLPSDLPIIATNSATNLGFIFYLSLSFSNQISYLSSTCNYIPARHRIRHTLEFKEVSVIATSRSLWGILVQVPWPQSTTEPNISSQVTEGDLLLWAVTGTRKNERVAPYFHISLLWLTPKYLR